MIDRGHLKKEHFDITILSIFLTGLGFLVNGAFLYIWILLFYKSIKTSVSVRENQDPSGKYTYVLYSALVTSLVFLGTGYGLPEPTIGLSQTLGELGLW